MSGPDSIPDQNLVHVVDDEIGVGDQISMILATQGLRTRVFASGAAFLNDYQPLSVAGCVLLDNGLLGMDGGSVLRAIVKLGHPPPVILMAYVHEIVELPRVAPCHLRFLRKPFTADQLIDQVVRALRQRRTMSSEAYLQFSELRLRLERTRNERARRFQPVDASQSEFEFRKDLLDVLDSAMKIGEAACGNVRLFNPVNDALEMRVHRGFARETLETFSSVRVDPTPCGRAFKQNRQVLVSDVSVDRGFQPYASIARASGFRSVQSSPIRVDGFVVGVLSTHFAEALELGSQQLSALEQHASMAARLIAGHR